MLNHFEQNANKRNGLTHRSFFCVIFLDNILFSDQLEEIEHAGILRGHVMIRTGHLIPEMADAVLREKLMIAEGELADNAVSRAATDDDLIGNQGVFGKYDLFLLKTSGMLHEAVLRGRHAGRRRHSTDILKELRMKHQRI